MSKPAPQRRVTEARIDLVVRGARRAGLTVEAVEVTKDGAVRVLTAARQAAQSDVDRFFDDKG